MGRVASLAGILGLVLLAFGFGATALVGLGDPFVLFNLVLGAIGIVTSLALGFQDFQTVLGQRSTRYGAGAAVYSVLFIALLAGGNYLSWRHHHRWDVTEAGVYTLAPQSKSIVSALTRDLQMTAFVDGGQDPQIESLLESYRYAAPERVKYELVDPDKRPELVDRLKITALRSVALQYGPESFVVTNPTEETVTNGIIRVARTTKKTVYFVEGHGEADVTNQQDPGGYAAAKLALEQENYEVKTLVLPSAQSIPADASAVVIPGPDRPLTDHELTLLDAYLKGGGHLAIMVGPRQGDDRLAKLLSDWGVKLGSNIVIDQEMRLFEGPSMGIQPITRTYGTHPITQNFRDYTTWPQTRTVTADAAGRKGFTATELVKTSPTSRALSKVDELFTKGTATIDESDPKGPLAIGVAVEAKLADLGIQANPPAEGKPAPQEARLVVFGTEQFADNQRLSQRGSLNADIFLNSVGWLVGQAELVSIRSGTVRASRAELTPADSLRVFYLSVLVVPELMVLAGIAVWWRRKSR